MSTHWPVPRPLEGVKSRKRAIFELKDAELKVKDVECSAAHLSLTLGSRIAALGTAGHAVTEVLLGTQEASSGCVNRHEQLNVLHIGPHLCDRNGIATALEARPQVLVLSFAIDDGEAWAATFREVIGSEELRSFQGAVVVRVPDEACIKNDLCMTRWVARGKQIRAEDISQGSVLVDDICNTAHVGADWSSLREQVSRLAADCFDDATEEDETHISAIAQEKKWTVAALAFGDPAQCAEGECKLLGYVTYGVDEALGGFYLARVAVMPEFRKRGHAYDLVQWMVERTRKEKYEFLWVNATSSMQTIHAALNFAYVDKADEAIAKEERGSAWMVLSLESPSEEMKPKSIQETSRKNKNRIARGGQRNRKR
jgi:GNAT superfamily N-acetyltransferase